MTIANTAISIIMAGGGSSSASGFVISTSIIVIFGEIIPQTVGNRFGLILSVKIRYVMFSIYYALFLFSFPIGAVLDKILGEEVGHVLSRHQIKRLFAIYEKNKMLNPSELKMLTAAIDLDNQTVLQVMTPLSNIYMLDLNSTLDHSLMKDIYLKGHSRIPVFDRTRDNIVGVLMARDLMMINTDTQLVTLKQLSSILIRDVVVIDGNTKIEPILRFFK
jgi:metal transporter CNNM